MRPTRVGTLWPLLLVVAVAIGVSPRAQALPAVQNVLGVYDGFYQSAVNPDDRGPVEVMITQQLHRRFVGTLTIAIGAFPFDGTIAASDQFSIVGRGNGAKFEVQGMVRFMGDGSVFVQSRYRFRMGPGRPDSGLLVLLRDTAARDVPDVVGTWQGTYQSSVDPADTGAIIVVCDVQTGSSFTGTLTVNGLVFPLVGTVGAPPDPASPYPFDSIGLGPAGWFRVTGNVTLPTDPAVPAEAMASYQLFFADGSRDAGTFDVFR
jgi:hypothetical protein